MLRERDRRNGNGEEAMRSNDELDDTCLGNVRNRRDTIIKDWSCMDIMDIMDIDRVVRSRWTLDGSLLGYYGLACTCIGSLVIRISLIAQLVWRSSLCIGVCSLQSWYRT
jgi:hypothetical protein